MKRWVIASLALLAAGCVSPGPKVTPGSPQTSVATRLSQEKISANRYRVSYIGPPAMSAKEIEDHTLMGAAKLTLDNGNEWFEVADQASGEHKHSIEIVMGKGETLAGGKAKQYPAKQTYAELKGRIGATSSPFPLAPDTVKQ